MAEEKLLAEWFWIDRYDGSSAALLNMECQGVYRQMLSAAWRRGARLPNDHEAIRRAIRCTQKEWKRCWPQLEGYWRADGENGEWLVNDTQLEVYAEAQAAKETARVRAVAAAEARWGKRAQAPAQGDARAHARAKPRQSPPSPSPTTTTPPLTPPEHGGGSNGNGSSTEALRQERRTARLRIDGQVEQARQFAIDGGYTLPRGWQRTFRDWFQRGATLAAVQASVEKGEHLPAKKL